MTMESRHDRQDLFLLSFSVDLTYLFGLSNGFSDVRQSFSPTASCFTPLAYSASVMVFVRLPAAGAGILLRTLSPGAGNSQFT